MPVACNANIPSRSGAVPPGGRMRCLPPRPWSGPISPITPHSRCQKSETPPAGGSRGQFDDQRTRLVEIEEVEGVWRGGVRGDDPEAIPVAGVEHEVRAGGAEQL